MKRLYLAFVIAALCLICGCAQIGLNRSEIDKIFVVRIVAIDRMDNNKVKLTITSKSIARDSEGQGAATGVSEIIASEGETLFEAARDLLTYADKRPTYGHTEYILFGEDTARSGIFPYLDFVSRNPQFRYNAKIYVIRGSTAFDFITKTNVGETDLSDKLTVLENNSQALSFTSQVTLSEAMYILDKKEVATFIPYLHMQESKDEDKVEISLHGYAAFKADKLQDFLSNDLSRGVNWIKNRIYSGVILINAPDGKKTSMEIVDSKTSIIPYMDENNISCTIKVMFSTNIAETMSRVNFFKPQYHIFLKSQQEEKVKKDIEQVLKYAQEKNLDLFDILASFYMEYPSSKKELLDNWVKLFPKINFKVEVDSNINRSYLLREPNGVK